MTRKFLGTVLSITVVLGIVSCSSEISRVRDNEIEITVSQTDQITETVATEEKDTKPETIPTEEISETSATVKEYAEESAPSETSEATKTSMETSVVSEMTEAVAETSQRQRASATPEPAEEPQATPTPYPEPTAAPTPTLTPTPIPTDTPTPMPKPAPVDVDQSAKDHGYEIIDIDMGDGQTQRIYGYYVDMSGLATKINDYRESMGLSRLPTDSGCVSEMKTRAAEATVKYSHWRPNGSGGQETNLSGGITPDEAYQGLYNSAPHRSSWESQYVESVYCVGFRRMVYQEDAGEWTGGGCATVVYFRDNLP